MRVQLLFCGGVRLVELMALDCTFEPDKDIFSARTVSVEKGIMNASLHVMELKVQSVIKHSFVYRTQSMPESDILITCCL